MRVAHWFALLAQALARPLPTDGFEHDARDCCEERSLAPERWEVLEPGTTGRFVTLPPPDGALAASAGPSAEASAASESSASGGGFVLPPDAPRNFRMSMVTKAAGARKGANPQKHQVFLDSVVQDLAKLMGVRPERLRITSFTADEDEDGEEPLE